MRVECILDGLSVRPQGISKLAHYHCLISTRRVGIRMTLGPSSLTGHFIYVYHLALPKTDISRECFDCIVCKPPTCESQNVQ